jgi:hypothetical protein
MKKLKFLLLTAFLLIGFQSSFALPLIIKKRIETTAEMRNAKAGNLSYELMMFDATKYKQVRVGVEGFNRADNDIYLDAMEGASSFSLGFFKILGDSTSGHNGSMLIDGAPTTLRIGSYQSGIFTVCIWAQ